MFRAGCSSLASLTSPSRHFECHVPCARCSAAAFGPRLPDSPPSTPRASRAWTRCSAAACPSRPWTSPPSTPRGHGHVLDIRRLLVPDGDRARLALQRQRDVPQQLGDRPSGSLPLTAWRMRTMAFRPVVAATYTARSRAPSRNSWNQCGSCLTGNWMIRAV